MRSVHCLNKWMVRKGAEVTVYTTDADEKMKLKVPVAIPVDQDGVRTFFFSKSHPHWWHYSKGLHKAVKKNISSFNIVHITSTFLAASTIGAWYAKKNRIPYMISPRGNLMSRPLSEGKLKKKAYLTFVENNNLKNASAIHFTSEKEKQEYLSNNFPLIRSFVIPNCLDFNNVLLKNTGPSDFFDKFGIDRNKKIILFLGRISPIKGLDDLIPAFGEIVNDNPDLVLAIAGGDDEGYIKKVKANIIKCGIRDKVVFLGHLGEEEKFIALKGSAVFVLPSYSESFGMAAVEAMCCGRPVIVTDGVGIAEDVKREGAGIVVKKSKTEIALAIKEIVENKKNALKMGEKGRLLAESYFSPNFVALAMISAYNSIVREAMADNPDSIY